MSDYGDGTPSKNPNLAKGLFLSKNQTRLMYQKHNAREGRWTPGNTIRLLHKTVHIKVNMNEGIYFDMAKVGPAVNAPKPREVSEGMLTVAVGMCNDAITPRHHMSKDSIKKRKNRSGNIARLRLSHTKGKYDICDSTGSLVEQMNINYYPKYNSREKRDIKAMDMWSLYESSRKNNVLWYERKMKDWRKARRQWEISLLENKYYVKKNYDLFRPRLTIGTVPAAIALGKEDNRREELALFNTGYTGEPPTSQKKMKAIGSGKGKTLVTDSEESDKVDKVDKVKVQRRIEKKMMLDEDEEEDIEELILGYSKGLGKTLAEPTSKNPEDIRK